MLTVHEATDADLADVRSLFMEYAATLGAVDLAYQGFPAELRALPGQYAPPAGVLLIARLDGVRAGCGALRPLERSVCEMKRLYVRPAARGIGAGRALARALIARARGFGYDRMRLDTLPTMATALDLYRTLGFVEIAPYYDTPIEGTVFMELDLRTTVPGSLIGR